MVEAFKASGTPVACLCSSAKVYAEQALPVAKALKEAGAQKVLLAGNVKELGEAALFVRHDVTSEEGWEAACARAVEEYGGLDILVNNAGIEITSLLVDLDVHLVERHAPGGHPNSRR